MNFSYTKFPCQPPANLSQQLFGSAFPQQLQFVSEDAPIKMAVNSNELLPPSFAYIGCKFYCNGRYPYHGVNTKTHGTGNVNHASFQTPYFILILMELFLPLPSFAFAVMVTVPFFFAVSTVSAVYIQDVRTVFKSFPGS